MAFCIVKRQFGLEFTLIIYRRDFVLKQQVRRRFDIFNWRSSVFLLQNQIPRATNEDPKIAKPALDSIAKSCAANLMVEKKEISVTNVTDEELKKDLRNMFQQLLSKTQERVIEGEAVRS